MRRSCEDNSAKGLQTLPDPFYTRVPGILFIPDPFYTRVPGILFIPDPFYTRVPGILFIPDPFYTRVPGILFIPDSRATYERESWIWYFFYERSPYHISWIIYIQYTYIYL